VSYVVAQQCGPIMVSTVAQEWVLIHAGSLTDRHTDMVGPIRCSSLTQAREEHIIIITTAATIMLSLGQNALYDLLKDLRPYGW
jgi:hypothetical protein